MADKDDVVLQPTYDLSTFQTARILNNNTKCKLIVALGSFPVISQTDQALVILEKTAFTTDNVENSESSYFSSRTTFKTEFINNIYGNFRGLPPNDINAVKVTVIYPATQKHIDKYSIQENYLINETAELYKKITEPHIKSTQFTLDWVYNILDHKKEAERIIFEDNDPDTGFILLPDLKWDGHTLETFYALAIIRNRNVKSLRDLNETHLPLLRNIRAEGLKVIENKYKIKSDQIRAYVHYQPSFYHFHVHFNPLNNEAPGILCEKSHLLDTVINNIELMSDYYQKTTLPFVLHADSLFEKFQKKDVEEEKEDGLVMMSSSFT